LHKGIVTYLWLSYRFAGIFSTRGLAVHIKTMVEERIEEVLGKFSFSETERRRKAERREKEVMAGLKREAAEAAAIEIEVGKEEDGQSQLRLEEDEIASENLADEVVQPLESGVSSLMATTSLVKGILHSKTRLSRSSSRRTDRSPARCRSPSGGHSRPAARARPRTRRTIPTPM